ncbi:MAG: SIMPL domain-containing protein [Candidatus Paceibacterota bacterium]
MEKNTNNNLCVSCGENTKSLRVIGGVLLAVLAVYVAVLAVNAIKANKYVGRDVTNPGTISVSGTGEVYKAPDLAVMDFSVVSENKTVDGAMEDNVRKMNAIQDVVKSLGVAEKDLQTSGFSVNPKYDYVKAAVPTLMPAAGSISGGGSAAADEAIYYSSGKRILSGYDVTQTLTVKIRKDNLSKIGKIIEEATASGANQVGDLQFTLDDPNAAQAEAREKAIGDAQAKAQKLAEQLKVKLVRIINYSDSGYYPSSVRLNYATKDAAGGGESVPTPNIQTGENKITSNVSISYEIE